VHPSQWDDMIQLWCFIPTDWSSDTPWICNTVVYEILGYVWSHLGQAQNGCKTMMAVQVGIRVTIEPPKQISPYCGILFISVCCMVQHSFFNFESVEATHTDCYLSRHFTLRCRLFIPLRIFYYINLCWMVCKGQYKNAFIVKLHVKSSLEDSRHCKLNYMCTDLAGL